MKKEDLVLISGGQTGADQGGLHAVSAGGGLGRMYAMLMATHYGLPFFLLPKMSKNDIMFLDND